MQLSTWRTAFPAAEGKLWYKTIFSLGKILLRTGGVVGAYIVTSDVHLIHPVSNWKQELDAKLLVCDIDIWNYLTSCQMMKQMYSTQKM